LRKRNWKIDAQRIVGKALDHMISSYGQSTDAFPIADVSDFKDWAKKFLQADKSSEESNRIWNQLWSAYIGNERLGVKRELWKQYELQRVQKSFSTSDRLNQKRLADLRYPLEWYPEARVMHRTIHLHVGPTNSGKTYHALKSLENSNSGVYAGPLRLLAHEVCGRLNARGKMCDLITGEERRLAQEGGSPLVSCTVEMISVTREVDVAVIDEVQMIGDPHRGWAWTEALLSVKAKEVHLCGEERVEPLIQRLADAMGEKLIVHRYERLTPLRTEARSLQGNIRNLRKGDCLVVFNRVRIHALRDQIQEATGLKAALIYGALPPASRNEQARLFNDPNSGYDILIASDAIGMGLNLYGIPNPL
jgi:ATP-dependent RNA helicase SUPV3L1/SUV3